MGSSSRVPTAGPIENPDFTPNTSKDIEPLNYPQYVNSPRLMKHHKRRISANSKASSPLSIGSTPAFNESSLEDLAAHIDTADDKASPVPEQDTTSIQVPPNHDLSPDVVPSDLLERLQTFSLFRNAPPLFHRLIVRRLKLIQYHPQEYIVKAGEPAKSMYWILRGTVGVTSTDGEATYAELVAGSFFGEIGILFNRPRTATVVARTRVLLGVLTKQLLNELLPDFPVIERLIRDEAQERLAMQEKKKKAGLVSLPSRRNSFSSNISGINASLALSAASTIPGPSIPLLQHNMVSPSPTSGVEDHNDYVGDVDETIRARDFLKNLPLFQALPSQLVHELALSVDLKKLDGFQYVFKKGDSGTDIFFVVAGQVEIIDPERANVTLARLGPGKYFGEMLFLSALQNGNDGDKRSADIRTIAETVLMIVTGKKLQNICQRYPLICEEMKQTVGERCKHNGSISSEVDPEENTPQEPKFKKTSYYSQVDDASDAGETIVWKDGFSDTSRSVSPLSESSKIFSKPSSISTVSSMSTQFSSKKLRKRSIQELDPLAGTTSLSVPPSNAQLASINSLSFNKPSAFQYMPLLKRLRLTSNNSFTRRRSSVLSTGPLSDRVMLEVFAYLDLKSLMKLRRVCRRWRQLLLISDTLFHTLDLTKWNTEITDSVLKHIIDFVGPRPRVVDISNCFHITDEGFSYLVNEIGIKGSIKVLKMKSVWKVSAMAIMDLSVPSVGHDMESIELVNCRNVRDDVLERLVGADFNADYHFNNQSVPNSFHHNFGCLNLKHLDLSYCKHLTDKTMNFFLDHCSQRLETLILTRCTTITDNGFRSWSSKQFPRLTKLVLKDCTYLTDNSMIYLAALTPNLKYLDLSFCCALNDSSIDFLCFCCKQLEYLNLSFCGSAVSDISLVSISRLNNLQKLLIMGCLRVTREGVDRLLAGSRSLSLINLSQCKNAHDYPYGGGPLERWVANTNSRSLFIKVEPFDRVIEIIL